MHDWIGGELGVGRVGLVAVRALEAVGAVEGRQLVLLVKEEQVLALEVVAGFAPDWQLQGLPRHWMRHLHLKLPPGYFLLVGPEIDQGGFHHFQDSVILVDACFVLEADHGHQVEDEGGLGDLLQF